jgi:hypothetical protein
MKQIVTGNTPEWNAKMEVYIAKARARGEDGTWFDMPKFKDINDNLIKGKKKLLKK